MPLLFGSDWERHPRIRVKLDTTHPIYAAHHQKLVCIDGSLAFVGGIDLTVRRWDLSRHLPDDPVRVSPDGPYPPVHDIQMAIDGDAAAAICSLAAYRWRNATGEVLEVPSPQSLLWPTDLKPDFRNTRVAIARAAPACGQEPAVKQVAALTEDALRAARDCIYIEAQYMTASYVGDVLVDALDNDSGPEVVIIMTLASRGLLERWIMGRNRDRLIRRLKRADGFDRFRAFYPLADAARCDQQVLIHSKLIIVDDSFIRVGSSNLNNRSIGLDTECDLAIEATTVSARQSIERIRNQLLAEHLGTCSAIFAGKLAAAGSVIAAIEVLNGNSRCLRPFGAMSEEGSTRPVFGTRLLDPKRPLEPLWFLRRTRRSAK